MEKFLMSGRNTISTSLIASGESYRPYDKARQIRNVDLEQISCTGPECMSTCYWLITMTNE